MPTRGSGTTAGNGAKGNQTTLVWLAAGVDAASLTARLVAFDSTPTVVAASDDDVARLLAVGIAAIGAQSYLSDADVCAVEDLTPVIFDRLPSSCPELAAATQHQEVSLWEVAENRILRHSGLLDALLSRAAARAALAAEKPGSVILVGPPMDLHLSAMQHEAEGLQVETWETAPQPPRITGTGRWARRVHHRLRRHLGSSGSGAPSPRVVLLSYSSRHAASLAPVIAEIDRRSSWNALIVSATRDSSAALRRLGLPYRSLWRDDTTDLRELSQRFRDRWATLRASDWLQGRQADPDGEKLGPLIQSKLEQLFDVRPGAGGMFRERFIEAARYVEVIGKLLDQLRPQLLVVLNEVNVLGRAAVLVARGKGVASLHVQHGIMAQWRFWRRRHADHVAVWGEAHRARLLGMGVDEDTVTVTGCARFDRLHRPPRPEAVAALRHKLGLGERPVILVTTQPDSMLKSRQQLTAVTSALRHLPDHVLVVKLHPAERERTYRKLLAELGFDGAVVTRDSDLYDLLAASSVLITRFSTTALEAMLLGLPVITMKLEGGTEILPFAASGAAIEVRDPDELLARLRSVFNNVEVQQRLRLAQQTFVSEFAHRIDGCAAERTVDLLDRLSRG